MAVIYNPASGRVRGSQKWSRIRSLLPHSTYFAPTTHSGHAKELAEGLALEGYSTIVAAGGDGTVHEVANGILNSGRSPRFGLLPLGSGNDYARLLRIPFTPREMVKELLTTSAISVDVGRIETDGGNSRWFINTVSLGLGGAVTCEARKIRFLRGIPLYGLAAIRAIRDHFHSFPVELTIDSYPTLSHLLYMAIALGRAEGGGFMVAPEALLDDGKFDVLHATKLSRWGALGYLPRMAMNTLPQGDQTIQRYQASRMEINSELGFAAHADGEVIAPPEAGTKSARIMITEKRLRVIGRPPMMTLPS